MRRIMLTVAYDGTNYHGWQIQPNAPTVEGVLNEALSGLFKENIKVTGASRTDTGVHALGNIAVFDTEAKMPAEKVSYALNRRLPDDIKIQDSREVPLDFHPRHCDSRKTYEYRILNTKFPMPVYRLYSYFTYAQLDVEKMKSAAHYFKGEHDFKSFCSAAADVETTVRTIYDISVSKQDSIITIRITGNGFLYNMVRIIAGTLIEAGMGRIEDKDIPAIIEARDRSYAGPTAPACGLTLISYEYLEKIPEKSVDTLGTV